MSKSKPPKPTEAELSVLRVVWRRGPSTVREVWEQISPEQQTGYTTVVKTMQIMFEKGLLQRDEAERSHVYSSRHTKEQTQKQVVGHLLERVFSGSARNLVMQALSVKKATPAELAEIRKLLDQLEGDQK